MMKNEGKLDLQVTQIARKKINTDRLLIELG